MSAKKNVTLNFVQGINTDIADELLPSGMYRGGKNIRLFYDGDKGIIKNVKGNVQVPFSLPNGQNICLGSKSDTENNQFYWFNWNENGFHGIYQYDNLLEKVDKIILNLTDTGKVDVLKFAKKALILHIDVKAGLLYWVDGVNNARKINISKALDKSIKGYGQTITEEYTNAYKKSLILAPLVSYFTDATKQTNYLYGKRFKAVARHLFDDNEKSNFSEFSTVPNPLGESILGSAAISNLNNGLKIVVETGSSIVKKIEIGLKINNLDFVSIIILDKERLGISNNTTYEYRFYNDNVSYSGLAQKDVFRAYSFMPDKPKLQALADSMIYGDGQEGFGVVNPLMDIEVTYGDLFLPDSTTDQLNTPFLQQTYFNYIFSRKEGGGRRWSDVKITVGNDVKKGNKFEIFATNEESQNLYFTKTADITDDAIGIANNLKQKLKASGNVFENAPEGLPSRNIYDNEIDSLGNVSFRFIWKGVYHENPTNFSNCRVNPVNYASLKDTGDSIGTHKSGGTVKYCYLYWNDDTKRSNGFTSESVVVRNSFVTETGGYKKIVHSISIKHQPPIDAKYWGIGRTVDLTYGNDFIHVLVQKAIESQSTTNTEYIDLVVGSLFTYQKMYPNTILNFNFEKNDRVRFIKKENTNTYYTFLETVVLDYKDYLEEVKNENIITDGTSVVVIGGVTNNDNIGRYISINGTERLITAVTNGTTYQLDRNIKFIGTVEFPQYKIIDRRGIIRVRKPIGQTIQDNSLIEVYKPTQNIESAQKEFFLFGKKFDIINPGTDQRCHAGSVQNQDPLNLVSTPAIVSISNGTTFVKGRALPTNNLIPGTQVVVDYVEDKNYSDFYESDLNDNGKIVPEDIGQGIKTFPERLWYSRSFIEDTQINNLNDFNNTDRKDYNDIYGAFKLLRYKDNLLYAFKELKSGYIPIFANIINDERGNELLGTSKDLLNKIKYFSHNGGISKNPVSFAESDEWMFFASVNSGCFCRIGGDGVLPISEQFGIDKKVKKLLKNAEKYNAEIYGGFDKDNDEYIASFEAFKEFVFNDSFQESNWNIFLSELNINTEYEVTTNALNGIVIYNATTKRFEYTPNTDYVGNDNFYYRYKEPGGIWSAPKKECLNIVKVAIVPVESIYFNAQLTVPFTKNDCGIDYYGSIVDYKVPQYKYSSVFSQDDADSKAINEANLNGQTKANTEGACIFNGTVQLPDFDYLKINYTWTAATAGRDLDTFTGFIDTGTIYDNDYVGYGQGDAKVPNNTTPYLYWAGDNTVGGKETVLVNFKQFILENGTAPNPSKIRMNATWFSGKLNGNVSVGITTYKGGTMSLDAPNFDFVNTGGVVVTDTSFPVNIAIENNTQLIANSQNVAIVSYNKTDNTATITLV